MLSKLSCLLGRNGRDAVVGNGLRLLVVVVCCHCTYLYNVHCPIIAVVDVVGCWLYCCCDEVFFEFLLLPYFIAIIIYYSINKFNIII